MEKLIPIFDNAQSFYNKAFTDSNYLFSYGFKVMKKEGNEFVVALGVSKIFSNTTLRHMKEFMKQHSNLRNITKKDILNLKREWL